MKPKEATTRIMLPFTKVHGLGNDFVVIDLRPGRPGADGNGRSPENPEIVRAICDRHFGIGADGVLVILPGVEGDARMRVLNADGGEAEMCGNGIRCVAKVLYESDLALRRPVVRIDTDSGLLECALEVAGGEVQNVTVEMGLPHYGRDQIPILPGGSGSAVREPITALGHTFSFTAVSMGNPHAVIFIDQDNEDLRALAHHFGPELEVAPPFPSRTNVEFARMRGGEIDLVVWERACGITSACGTGACATVAAACLEKRLERGAEVTVNLPGGPLEITVAPDDSGVRMRGAAEIVFRGELNIETLVRPGSRRLV